jgi:hypothetical protein
MVFTTLHAMAQVGPYCQYYPECALALPSTSRKEEKYYPRSVFGFLVK